VEKNQVSKAVHFSISAKNIDGLPHVAGGKCLTHIRQHLFQHGGHMGEFVSVLWLDTWAGCQSAVSEAEQKVTDPLQANHDFHTGEQFAGAGLRYLSYGSGYAGIDFHMHIIEFFFSIAQGIEQCFGPCGNPFSGSRCCILGDVTSLHRASNQLGVRRGWSRSFEDRGTHSKFLPSLPQRLVVSGWPSARGMDPD